jgi:penicillin-binding protein 1C
MRLLWRILRTLAIVTLLPTLVLVELVMLLVVAQPLGRTALTSGAEPLELVDIHGEEIVTIPADGIDRTHWTALGELPAIAVTTIIQSEDEDFWRHGGVDGVGIVRALWLDAQGGRFGGSTLTMQVARMLRGDAQRSVPNKLHEMMLALRLERALDKRQILEQWLNRAYFGNGVSGFDAAARLYFGKPASALSAGEATLLAVVPRAPSAYDLLRHPEAARKRRAHVLGLLVERGVLDAGTARDIDAEQVAVARHSPANAAPHFARFALAQVPADVRRAGGIVHTSLDLGLQRVLERRVDEQVAALRGANLEQAGIVVLDAQTAEVRAMVGSTAITDDGGEINFTTRRRHPGSALKPFVYATAIERGAAPTTIAWDTRDTSDDSHTSEAAQPGGSLRSHYFAPSAGVEHGPVRYREALASSYNFAAIDVLQSVGVARVMTVLRTAGVAEVAGAPNDYGLRLALGAAKVRLVDLVAGYAFLVRGGQTSAARAVERVTRGDGTSWLPAPQASQRVFSPQTSWLVMDMLSDPEARRPGFGMELPFDLPFRIAAKTGTARGFSDTWAVGATREVVVGAWAGAFDGKPMQGLVGMDAAAPLVRDAMLAVAARSGHALTLPARPDGIVDVVACADTGAPVGVDDECPTVHDYAVRGRAPIASGITRAADGSLVYPARADGWLKRRRAAVATR